MANRRTVWALTLAFLTLAAAVENGCQRLPSDEATKVPPAPTIAAPLMIPDIQWQPHSDWVNVKTAITPAAVGDGQADDTAALQAALDQVVSGTTLYLPAGIYRITAPLIWGNRLGVALLGEDPAKTIVRYDGPAGEAMLTLHGVSYSKFGRITWDGQGKEIGRAHV